MRTPRPSAFFVVACGAFFATRLAAALLVPEGVFASDEGAYWHAGTDLALHGTQDVFWPPLTGWLIALVTRVVGTASVVPGRVLWHAMDLAVFCMLPWLVRPLQEGSQSSPEERHPQLGARVLLAYALYVPAVGFATFTTSEMPALMVVTAVNIVLLRPSGMTSRSSALAGALAGLLTLARTSLGCWVVALPVFILMGGAAARQRGRCAALAALASAAVVGGAILWNGAVAGRYVLGTSAYHNLYIGNERDSQEDLNLLSPRATPAQVAFRAQRFADDAPAPEDADLTDRERVNQSAQNISRAPFLFLRRAAGRLARVFAPKTEELELLGGESRVSVRSVKALLLLSVTNLEWGAAAGLGIFGFAYLARRYRDYWRIVALNLLAALPPCLIAISKPRYSFPFDIFFIIAALAVLESSPGALREIWARRRRAVVVGWLALLWAWVAWGIFAVTSRAG